MSFLDVCKEYFFGNSQKAEEIKRDLKKRIFYEEKVINMSDRSLSKIDRKELYDFFRQNNPGLHTLKTRVESVEELETLRNASMDRCFKNVKVKYPFSFRFFGDKFTKFSYYSMFGLSAILGVSVFLVSLGVMFMKPFEFFLMHGFPKITAFLVSCVAYNAFHGDKESLEIFKDFALAFACHASFLVINRLGRYVDNVLWDLMNKISDVNFKLKRFLNGVDENFSCVFNGSVTKCGGEKSLELTNVISDFYRKLTQANNMHYGQIMQNFGQKIKNLQSVEFNLVAVNLMISQKKQSFKGLVDIFHHQFVVFYEMTRPRNLMQFEKLLQEDKNFAKIVSYSCKMHKVVDDLLKLKNLNVPSSVETDSFHELLEEDVEVANLVNKKGALTKTEMKNLAAKGLMFGGKDFLQFRENKYQPSASTEDKWVQFLNQSASQEQRSPTI